MPLYCRSVLGSVANAALGGRLRLRGLDQQAADGTAFVERIETTPAPGRDFRRSPAGIQAGPWGRC